MSHHKLIYDKDGNDIGFLRITNEGEVLSVWIDNNGFMGLFNPETRQQSLDRYTR
jgi:hypothetical protein